MGSKIKPEKRERATGKTAESSAGAMFRKGGRPGPGRGHRRERGDLAGQPTPREAAGGGGIACEGCEELTSRLELREAELARLRGELAEAERASARQSVEWSLALAALARHPSVRDEVLAAVWPAESPVPPGRGLLGGATAGQAVPAGEPAAEGAAARPGGDQAAGTAAGATPPAGRRDSQTVSDGVRRRDVKDVNPSFGGWIERGGNRGPDEVLDDRREMGRGHGRYGDEF